MLRISALLLVVGLFWGCQTTVEPFTPSTLQDPGNALIYVYWPGQRWREKSGQYPEIRLDGVPIGILRYKTYLMIEVAAGDHELRMTADSEAANWTGIDQFFSTPLKRGEIKYVRLLVRYDQNKNSLSDGLMTHVVLFLPRAGGQARLEMADLKEVRNRN